jgi:hypothetical protein
MTVTKQPALSDAQLTAAFEAVVGMPPRTADRAVMQMMGATPENVADYLWDHWLGEPETPDVNDVLAAVQRVVRETPR